MFSKSTRIRVMSTISVAIIILTHKRVTMIMGTDAMDYSELYVKRIRMLCRERKITVNKLATMSDVKQSTLDNIMRHLTKNPRVKTLSLIHISEPTRH